MSESSQISPAAFRHPCAPGSHSRRTREMDRGPSAPAPWASAPRSAIRDPLRLRVRGKDPGCPEYLSALLPDIPWLAAKGIFLSTLQSHHPIKLMPLPVPDNLIRWRVRVRASESC